MKRFGLCAIALLGFSLAGCANQGAPASGTSPAPSNTAALAVTAIQVFYIDLKADAAIWVKSHPADATALGKAETILDPEIAALSNDSAPASVSVAIADIQNQVNALPPGVLSEPHKAELDVVLGFAGELLSSADPHVIYHFARI